MILEHRKFENAYQIMNILMKRKNIFVTLLHFDKFISYNINSFLALNGIDVTVKYSYN